MYTPATYLLKKKDKTQCYSSEDSITISETLAEIKLQGGLDHTTSRFCKYLKEIFNLEGHNLAIKIKMEM